MNPLRLLTKGRTIRGLKERPGAYKLMEKSALPNFSGPKRPVPTTPHPEPVTAQSALFEQPQPKPETPVPVKACPVPVPAPIVTPTKEQPSEPGLWSRLTEAVSGWTQQRIPWRKAPPFQSPTIQTELGLDKVRVIRNDLSDDDLEVVTMDKKAGKKTKKPAPCEEVEHEKLTANP